MVWVLMYGDGNPWVGYFCWWWRACLSEVDSAVAKRGMRGRLVVGVVGVCLLAWAWLAADASPGARLEVCGWSVGRSRWLLALAGWGFLAGGEAWGAWWVGFRG